MSSAKSLFLFILLKVCFLALIMALFTQPPNRIMFDFFDVIRSTTVLLIINYHVTMFYKIS